MYFANVKLKDFNLEYDRKSNRITMKALDEMQETKQVCKHDNIRKPEKRRKMKI